MEEDIVPNDRVGAFVQDLLDGPEFGTAISIAPNYTTGKSVVKWTLVKPDDAAGANARTVAPDAKSKKKRP